MNKTLTAAALAGGLALNVTSGRAEVPTVEIEGPTTMSIYKGERRDVPEWTWATLAADAANANAERKAGDLFGLTEGGQVEIIGEDREFGVLVRYTLPPTKEYAAGTSCPDGALLFLSPSVIARWPAAGTVLKKMSDEAADRARVVERLLKIVAQ